MYKLNKHAQKIYFTNNFILNSLFHYVRLLENNFFLILIGVAVRNQLNMSGTWVEDIHTIMALEEKSGRSGTCAREAESCVRKRNATRIDRASRERDGAGGQKRRGKTPTMIMLAYGSKSTALNLTRIRCGVWGINAYFDGLYKNDAGPFETNKPPTRHTPLLFHAHTQSRA